MEKSDFQKNYEQIFGPSHTQYVPIEGKVQTSKNRKCIFDKVQTTHPLPGPLPDPLPQL